jgi:mono/diheme cytochrome c family protein
MKFKKRYVLLFLLAGFVVLVLFLARGSSATARASKTEQNHETADGKTLFNQYCGSCHLAPAPERLTKEIWKTRVLPVMAIKMGLEDEDYERKISEEEKRIEKENHLVPEHPMIAGKELDKISAYILANAPDSLPVCCRTFKSQSAAPTIYKEKHTA